ncbi:hypothetical protein AAC387_Pa08g0999 [Persea americana]
MEGMVTDLTLARENQTNFEEYLNSNPHANPRMDLTITVLTTGFWPSYKSFDLNLPAEMLNVLKFPRSSIKQKPSIENLHGSIHLVLVTSMGSLN